ncbi:unnamed protein product [Caenorhabditis bovis]|uniref:PID domain-containing protein n=1 Tax=Caenorhabditis bovis TaxID=2654633 RepID=A0A8S1F917_9PELO|nr:unnamed protein product [Caenorhabditis bovis]
MERKPSVKDKDHNFIFQKSEVFEAAKNGDYDKIAIFLSSVKVKKNRVPINFFRPSCDTHWLLHYRDDKSEYTLLHHSSYEGRVQISKLLMDYEPLLVVCEGFKKILPIHLAAWNGHLEIVKQMILLRQEKPVNLVNALNIFNESPLHLAIQRSHFHVAEYLLKKNSDPFIRNDQKENALDIAARIGHSEAIILLCKMWPNFPIQSAYESLRGISIGQKTIPAIYPLHLAAKNNHVKCLEALKNAGFNLNYTTEDGTALHVAAACGQVESVDFLLTNGTNPQIRNQHGHTALDLVIELQSGRRSEIACFLKNPEGWAKCRKMLEDFERHDSGRETEGSQSDNEKEAIWQQIPNEASVQYYPDQRKNNRQIYRPPSIAAVFSNESSDEIQTDQSMHSACSVVSYPNSSLTRTWNSSMYDKVTGVPRFPKTNPFSYGRHNAYSRCSDTLPTKLNANRTKPSPPRGCILPGQSSPYRGNPPLYDEWKQSQATLNNGVVMPMLPGPYDNIPQEAFAFDRAQLSARNMSVKMAKQNGYSTLPTPSDLHKKSRTPISPETFERTPVREANVTRKMSRTTCDREDSLGLTNSPRLDTRASSVTSSLTYACSTLERDLKTPVENGRAPLAMPEEITGSALFRSPEKDDDITIICRDPCNPPSPNTSKATIFETLCTVKPSSFSDSKFGSFFTTSNAVGSTGSVISSESPSSSSKTSEKSPSSPSSADMDRPTSVRLRRQIGTSNLNLGNDGQEKDWDEVDKIFSCIGIAPCRESVFIREYESNVANYLCDPDSKAVALQHVDLGGKSDAIQQANCKISMYEWLENVVGIRKQDAKDIGATMIKFGFDKYTQLKGSLDLDTMSKMGIAVAYQQLIMSAIAKMEDKRKPADSFYYVSDWLCSLELVDYLTNIIGAGFKKIETLKKENLTEAFFKNIGIHLPGHLNRIMYSLYPNESAAERLCYNHQPRQPRCEECPSINFSLIKNALLRDGIVFRAHHLGARQVAEADITEDQITQAIQAMQSAKSDVRDWNRIPYVSLELTANGVRIMDINKQIVQSSHGVYNISMICQDRKDLNFFCIISRGSYNRFVCHTFCVLTSALTYEIITTMGIMFELRARIDGHRSLDEPIQWCPHIQNYIQNKSG